MKFWTVTRKLHDLHEGSRESIKKDIFFPWACSRHTPKVITASRKLLLILPTDTSFFLFLLSFFSFWHRALYIRKDSCIQTRSQMIDDIPSEKKDKLLYFMNIQVEGLSLSRACYNFSLEHTTVRWEKQHFKGSWVNLEHSRINLTFTLYPYNSYNKNSVSKLQSYHPTSHVRNKKLLNWSESSLVASLIAQIKVPRHWRVQSQWQILWCIPKGSRSSSPDINLMISLVQQKSCRSQHMGCPWLKEVFQSTADILGHIQKITTYPL